MIDIKYGIESSDCTAEYYITTDNTAVREFIEEWLSTRPKEWGYFGIKDKNSIIGNLRCEYRYGRIITDPIPDEFLDKKIKKVYGSGGWTRSDFLFEVK